MHLHVINNKEFLLISGGCRDIMQNPVGEVISLPAPQGISANTENTGYHGDQVTHRVTMETSSGSQAPVSGKTQIEEAHR